MQNQKKFTPQIAAMYLGCEVETPEGRGVLSTTTTKGLVSVTFGAMQPDFDKIFWVHEIKPILRPLWDISEEEDPHVQGIVDRMGSVFQAEEMAEITAYLLSKHFDLFGLIEAGEAIDKTKI